MDKKFLIDTNIVVYYTNGGIPAGHLDEVTDIFRKSFLVSSITKIEVLGWHKISDLNKEKLSRFMEHAHVIYIDAAIEDKTIEIRQSYKIDTPDAIIAATAVCYELTLVTRNAKDFEQIKGLNIYNPFWG